MDARDGDGVDAQAEHDADPELQELLTRAALSPTVHRDDADDAHRERVHEAADRALDKDADLIQRLRDDDDDDGRAWVDRLRSGSRLRDVIADDGDDDADGADDPTAI